MDRLSNVLLVALPLIVIGIIIGVAFPDIRRYLEIRRM